MFAKLKEYVKLVPKFFDNPENIIQGYWNNIKMEHGLLPEDEQEEILRRRLICGSCEFNSILAKKSEEYKELYGDNYHNPRTDFHCSICACKIHPKTAALDEACGLRYYNDTHPDNKQDLKWIEFKKPK